MLKNKTITIGSIGFLILLACSSAALPAYAEIKNGMDADLVIGERDFNTSTAGPTQQEFGNDDVNTYADGHRLYVSDRTGNRVLIWNSIPTQNFAPADVVVGQADFTSSNNGVTQTRLSTAVTDVNSDGTRLFICDRNNRRVLIYNKIPDSNLAPADVVVGQPDFVSNANNQGGARGAHTIDFAEKIYVRGTRLFVADNGNARIAIWNRIPTSNNTPADVVVGQPDFTTADTGLSRQRIQNTDNAVFADDTRLFVCDRLNHRVLIWNRIPTTNFAPADVVIGQPDFESGRANQGGAPGPNTINAPRGGCSDGRQLFILDNGNRRVLYWKSIPTVNNTPADAVIGQPDFQTVSSGIARNKINGAFGIAYDGRRLFVVTNSTRVLIFNLGSSGIELGPQFEQGKAVLGKVFWDWNGNGVQDGSPHPSLSPKGGEGGGEGEETGIEGVKVASDTGIYAITDEDGKYHFPYIETGQHVLKIDESTLPEGSKITTESPRKIVVTAGILTKVSFGVKPPQPVLASPAEFHLGGEAIPPNTNNPAGNTGTASSAPTAPRNDTLLKVSISQDPALLKPKLSVSAQQEPPQNSGGQARTQGASGPGGQGKIIFTIDCNYFLFIQKANLILYNKNLEKIKAISLPQPLPYRYAIDLKNLPPTDTLHYQLSVFDKSGKEDRTGIGILELK